MHSAWLKCHYPDIFAAAILNSQPMGFYAPAQLVRDAKNHGVEARPVDINHSNWDCTLEPVEEQTKSSLFPPPTEGEENMAARPKSTYAKVPQGGRGKEVPPGTPLPRYALRLGLRQIKGFSQIHGDDLIAAREEAGRPFADPADLWRRARLPVGALETLSLRKMSVILESASKQTHPDSDVCKHQLQ